MNETALSLLGAKDILIQGFSVELYAYHAAQKIPRPREIP